MSDCIFCKIIEGKLPSAKLYEDEASVVILDINPIAPGHSLLISKKHYPTLLDAHPDDLARMTKSLLKVVPAILKETNAEGFNIIANNQRCAGQLVPHLHFHIVPRNPGDPIHFNWNPRPSDKDEMARLLEAIRKHL